jgi:DNA-directed RNA polymerase beta subunit
MMKDPKMIDTANAMYPYFPHEARIRNMTYQIDTKVDVHIEKRKRNSKDQPGDLIEKFEVEQIELCKIPVMVRSSQCHLNDENDRGIIR